jgi:hypothetical protein
MAKAIKIDRTAIYDQDDAANATIKTGELRATRRCRRDFIDGESLWRWLTGHPQESGASNA